MALPEADSLDTQAKIWGTRALHTSCKAVYELARGQQGPLWGECETQCVLTCCKSAGEGAGTLGQQELTALNVELGESTTVVETYRALCSLQAELKDLHSLASGPDEDLRALAAEEHDSLLAQVLSDAP